MKRIFVAIMALGALVSCSKDELVSVNRQAIQFGNAFVENSTRATAADVEDPSYGTNKDLESFYVYGTVNGVQIFDGITVSKGTAEYGDAWTQEDGQVQYWVPGAEYVFDAFYGGNVTISNNGLVSSLTYETPNQFDMLHNRVTIESAAADEGVVTFEFTHLLSKVKFSVQNTSAADASNYRFNLTDIELRDVYKKASYVVTGGTWDYTYSDTYDYVLDDLIVNSADTQYNLYEVLLIPGSNVNVYINGTIQTKKIVNGQETWEDVSTVEKTFSDVLGTNGALTANKAYHFAVTLGIGNAIEFSATTLDEWANGNTADSDSDDINDYVPVE